MKVGATLPPAATVPCKTSKTPDGKMEADELDDEHVANLLKQDAKASGARYAAIGLQAFLPRRSISQALKPNTRFLRNILRETDSHNAALLAKEAEESRARLKAMQKDGYRMTKDEPRLREGEKELRPAKRRRTDKDGRDYDRSLLHRRDKDGERSPRHSNRDQGHSSRRRVRNDESHGASDSDRDKHRSGTSRKRRRHSHSRERDSELPAGCDHEKKDSKRHRHRRDGSTRRHRAGSTRRHRDDSCRRRRREEDHRRSHSGSDEDAYHTRHRSDYEHRKHRHRRSQSHDRSRSTAPRREKSRKRRENRSRSRSLSPVRAPDTDGKNSRHIIGTGGGYGSDPLEDIVGPLPPAAPIVRSKGRGMHKNSSAIDAHFSTGYNPSTDVQVESDQEDDWGQALEALRDRETWHKQGADRLRSAGFSEAEIQKWEKGGEKTEADVRWAKKGEGREWDRGKVVNDLGETSVSADWGRLKEV